jgi:phenylalanyl-tRNA synthetase beta chain
MKVSVNSIRVLNREHDSSGDPAPDGVDKLVDLIGTKLGAVEAVIDIGKKYESIVIVRVVSCDVHPNANRLQVCRIDDGGKVEGVERLENGYIQVVCGAPNVVPGVTVAWLPPGTTVPATFDTDPFVLESREIRGQISYGMLASPRELGLGESHEGLLIIDEEVEPGTPFSERFGLNGDKVIDMENKMFTHRPDCFGWLGVAREFAGIQGQAYKSPEWYRVAVDVPEPSGKRLPLEVQNELPQLVPRFVAVPIADITIAPSPIWLQVELSRVGIRPINNIVDLTNFFMVLTGQPIHAYDYDKVAAHSAAGDTDANALALLTVRFPGDGEKITLLNGKEITPRPEAMMVAAGTDGHLACVGGIMGGADTEVDKRTKNIIIEAATWDMYGVRRTAMAHGIFTDAVTRFTKGQSPLQNMAVLSRMVETVLGIAGGRVAGPVIDFNHVPPEVRERQSLHPDVVVSGKFINERLGLKLSIPELTKLLTNVEFSVTSDKDKLTVRAPFWRTDIELPEDVVEEIGRLYGFDKLPLDLPKRTITPVSHDIPLQTKSHLRTVLSRAGANEILSYSFIHSNLITKAGQDSGQAYKLTNALSPDLQYYRLSLTPSLLDKIHSNIKAGFDEFALFELGKVHGKSELDDAGLPKESSRLGFVYAAGKKHVPGAAGSPYYQAVQYLEHLLPGSFLEYQLRPLNNYDFGDYTLFEQMAKPFEPQRSAVVYKGDHIVGIVGEYRQAVQKALKLPAYCAGFELFLSGFEKPDTNSNPYIPLPRYPKVTQDITLKVGSGTTFREVYDAVWNGLEARNRPDDLLITLTPLDLYQKEEDPDYKQVTLRLVVASYEKTMTDNEVVALLDQAANQAYEKIGAERI